MRRIILAIIIIITLVGTFWLFNHGYIALTPETNSKDQTSYAIVNQGSGKSFNGTTDKPFKHLLSRSGFSIYTSQGNKSYFTTAHTKGFLQTTTVAVKGQPQNSRRFVGNNPSNCMNLINAILVSYSCGGTYNKLVVHEPASASTPTSTHNNASGFAQTVEGISNTSAGNYMVLRAIENIGQSSAHIAYNVTSAESTLTPNKEGSIPLNGLDNNSNYTISSYKDGLLAHSINYDQIAYYPAKSGIPSYINPTKPSKGVSIGVRFDNTKDAIAEVFTSSPSDTENGKTIPGQKTEIIITKDNSSKKFGFAGNIFGMQLCGNQKLCLVTSNGMEVYDVAGKKMKYLFTLPGVKNIIRAKDGVLALVDRSVWFINPDIQTGYAAYTLGDYQFNQFTEADHGALLTLTNSIGKRIVLYLNLDEENVDSIDIKVSKLIHSSNVKDVSAYGKYIYISPNYGEVKPQVSGDFDYDPAVVQKINTGLQQDINDSGISSEYTIINSYSQQLLSTVSAPSPRQ